MLHLAIVSPYPPALNGIGQYGYYFSHAMARSGAFDRITLLSSFSTEPDPIHSPANMQIVKTWHSNSLSAGQAIAHHIQKLKPDLVWFNLGASTFGSSPFANLSGFSSLNRVRRMGIPIVLTLHELIGETDLRALRAPGGPLAHIGVYLLMQTSKQADVICLTFRRYRDILKNRWPELHLLYIPIGAYHTPEILPVSHRQNLLFFAMMAPFKGLDVLLRAFRLLQPLYPELHLTIAGAKHARFPDYTAHLQKAYQDIPNVDWIGPVGEADVPDIFKSARIVVLPYTAFTGSSSVLYQAATWGRPVIASDLPDLKSLISENNLNVRYFQSGSPESLAVAIQRLLRSPADQQKLIQHNMQVMRANGLEETCRLYLRAFDLALEIHCSPERITDLARLNLEPCP